MFLGILLAPIVMILPAILRHIIIKKPISKVLAGLIVAINAILMITIFVVVLRHFGYVPSKNILPAAAAFGSIWSYQMLKS